MLYCLLLSPNVERLAYFISDDNIVVQFQRAPQTLLSVNVDFICHVNKKKQQMKPTVDIMEHDSAHVIVVK